MNGIQYKTLRKTYNKIINIFIILCVYECNVCSDRFTNVRNGLKLGTNNSLD